jgi:MFS family permease
MDTSTSAPPSLELKAIHKSIADENYPQNISHIAPLPTAPPDLLEQDLETDFPASSELTFDADTAFPEGGRPAWLCVCGAFFLLLSSLGFMVSIGTLQTYWEIHQLAAYSTRDIGWIPSVFVYLGLALGIWVGPVFDRYGPRLLVLSGSSVYTMMLFLLAECSKYWHFMLCLGVMGGISAALILTAAFSCISHWFKRRRGLATGVAMMGTLVGGVIIPLLLRSTLNRYSWKWAIRILAFVITGCLAVGNVFIRGRLKSKRHTKTQPIISLSIFSDMRFTFLTLSTFSFEFVLFAYLCPVQQRLSPINRILLDLRLEWLL